MVLPRHGHVLIGIKLILSVNVFKIPHPLGVSGPRNKIFPKPEVNHDVKIDVFALDIAFKLD